MTGLATLTTTLATVSRTAREHSDETNDRQRRLVAASRRRCEQSREVLESLCWTVSGRRSAAEWEDHRG